MAETRWLDDQQQLAWRALLAIYFRAMPELERTFKANDLLNVQYGILAALSESPGRTLQLTELAEASNTSQSRLTHRLRDLIARGDVEISHDETDRRAKHARLTDAGLRRLEQIAPLHAEEVQRLIFDALDPAQTEALADALATIAGCLCDSEHFQRDC